MIILAYPSAKEIEQQKEVLTAVQDAMRKAPEIYSTNSYSLSYYSDPDKGMLMTGFIALGVAGVFFIIGYIVGPGKIKEREGNSPE